MKKILQFQARRTNKIVCVYVPIGYKKSKLPFFEEWTDALESGKYRQCQERLCSLRQKRYHYCCLGVLSKVQGRLIGERDGVEGDRTTLSPDNVLCNHFSEIGNFPECCEVRIYEDEKALAENHHCDVIECLTELNDNAELTFKEISSIIRCFWKK